MQRGEAAGGQMDVKIEQIDAHAVCHTPATRTAKALVALHALIGHSHLFPSFTDGAFSSLIKAVCCDAFNIIHIQCKGRI